jgi:hypothetical protein
MAAENFTLDEDDLLAEQPSAVPLRQTFEVEYIDPVRSNTHADAKGQADALEEEDKVLLISTACVPPRALTDRTG